MKELTKKEIESQRELERNLEFRLTEFKKVMRSKTKEQQQKELSSLKHYIDGCRKSEIDDTLVNICFCESKIAILESLI